MTVLYLNVVSNEVFTEEELKEKFEVSQNTIYVDFEDMLETETAMGGDLMSIEYSDTDADIVIAARDNHLYDYIANHYWEMSKDELKEVLLMAIATLQESSEREYNRYALTQNLVDRLMP